MQVEFAGERIAEIQILVEKQIVGKKAPKTKAIEKAKTLLLGNMAHAAEIMDQEKASGKDVSQLAKDIDDQFDAREKLLTQTFLDAREKLATQHKELKDKLLKDAQAIGDTDKVAEITGQLNDIQNQANNLKNKKNEIKTSLRAEKKKIEQNMNQEDQHQDESDQNDEDQLEQKQEREQVEFENENENENDSESAQEGNEGENEAEQEGDQDGE